MVGSEEGDGWMNKSKVTNRCSWINKEIDFSMGQVLPPSATLFILVTTLPETTDICKRWSTDMQILHNFLDANDNLTINRFMDSEQKAWYYFWLRYIGYHDFQIMFSPCSWYRSFRGLRNGHIIASALKNKQSSRNHAPVVLQTQLK